MAVDTIQYDIISEARLVTVPNSRANGRDRFGFDKCAEEASYDFCIPMEKLRQREMKWTKMFSEFDKYRTSKRSLLKKRCRKGIPYSVRGRAWSLLTAAEDLEKRNPNLFQELLKSGKVPEKDLVAITKDLHRTFPKHEHFSTTGGQEDLRMLLTALISYKPEQGYCQAMAPVVATLLIHMPVQSAFWVMVRIMDAYLPGYYTEGFEEFQVDCETFDMLLELKSPHLSRHLKGLDVSSVVYLLEWFMCIYCRTFPFSCALRILDMFFLEGPVIIYKTAIAIMKLYLEENLSYLKYSSLGEFYPDMRHLPEHVTHEQYLIPAIINIKIQPHLLEKLHEKAQKNFKIEQERRLKLRALSTARNATRNVENVSSSSDDTSQ